MKYLHLVWSSLWRRRTRTALTLVSIIAAFLLFGLLDAVRTSFSQIGQSANGAQRLQVGSRLSFIQTLPFSLGERIATVPGVGIVTFANWFGATYQDARQQVFCLAVAPNYLDAYPEIAVDPAERKAFDDTRTGALVGEELMKRYGWKVGDHVPLNSMVFPDRQGGMSWPLDIVGVLHARDKDTGRFFDQMVLMQWKHFDETTPYNRGAAGWYIARVTDVNQADRVAKAIDAISANSDHETRTQSEQAANASWMKQIADIGLIVGSIMGAVFFTLLLLTGNTMMQAVRERTSELAVMKTLGFPDGTVTALVLAESVLLLVLGGVIGLGLATLIIPGVSAASGGMLHLPVPGPANWLLGLVFMVLIGALVGAVPARSAMRLVIVDALRR